MSPIAAATMPMRREKIPLLVERVVTIAGLPGRRCFPGGRLGGFHTDPPGLTAATLERKYWPCPVPPQPASVGVVRSGVKVWGLVGAESHRNRATCDSIEEVGTRGEAVADSTTVAIDVGPPPGGARFVRVPVNHHGSCPRRQ
jgi:hypothetical protein